MLKIIIRTALVIAVISKFSTVTAAEIYKGETAGAGDPVHAMFVA